MTAAETSPAVVALCLSGGGYRATLFHLGALRRLNEVGLLSRVSVITSVSGGSIMSAQLAQTLQQWPAPGARVEDWEGRVAAPLRAFCHRDIRTGPILRRLWPWNWPRSTTQVDAIAATYGKRLVQLTLGQLPPQPRFVFCATDMVFGVNWVFEPGRIGDYQAGYWHGGQGWPVARAVAASSCFPPIFGPLRPGIAPELLQGGKFPPGPLRDKLIRRMQLTDGGVYDNLGLEPVTGEGSQPNVILVSDGGAPIQYEVTNCVIWRLLRYSSILQEQIGRLRRHYLVDQFKHGQLMGAYWGISSAVERYDAAFGYGYPKDLAANHIARIRTDLDAFSADEAGVLENHGYWLAEAALEKHVFAKRPELRPGMPVPLSPPRPDLVKAAAALKALKGSQRRALLGRKG